MDIQLSKVCLVNRTILFSPNDKIYCSKMVSDFVCQMNKKNQSAEHYEKYRHASSPSIDIAYGKYGEIGAYRYLRSQGFPKGKLDFGVRQGGEKGWVSDICFSEPYPDVSVKTCKNSTVELAGTYSWVFQFFDPIKGRDPLFDTPESDEPIVFMYVSDLKLKEVKVVAVSPWRLVYPLLKLPIVEQHKRRIRCLYYNDLEKCL